MNSNGKDNLSCTFSVRFTDNEIAVLRAAAERTGLSVGDLVRFSVRNQLPHIVKILLQLDTEVSDGNQK